MDLNELREKEGVKEVRRSGAQDAPEPDPPSEWESLDGEVKDKETEDEVERDLLLNDLDDALILLHDVYSLLEDMANPQVDAISDDLRFDIARIGSEVGEFLSDLGETTEE